MFITDKLIYLQLQKTGCTHIAHLLSKTVTGKQICKHNWLQSFENDKYIVGSIRNPWDWYVSLWAYGCMRKGGFYKRTTNKDFVETLRRMKLELDRWRGKRLPPFTLIETFQYLINEIISKPIYYWKDLYKDVNNPELFQKWLKTILTKKGIIYWGEGYKESSISNWAGLLTYRYCLLYEKRFFQKKYFKGIGTLNELKNFDKNNNILDFIIRTENLEEDLICVLRNTEKSFNNKFEKTIYQYNKINTSKHRATKFYYDKETVNLVEKKERFIIEKYGYYSPLK